MSGSSVIESVQSRSRSPRRGTLPVLIAIVGVLLSPNGLWAETLAIGDAIERTLEVSDGVRRSENEAREAAERFELTRLAIRPDLTLAITPYSFDRRRVPAGGSATQETTTHSVGVGLSVAQGLPTSGRLSASLDHTVRLTQSTADTIAQVPELVVSLSQPLFAGSGIIDTSVFNASQRNAAIASERATVLAVASASGAALRSASLFVQVVSLRRSLAVLEQTLDVLARQLESAELDREQGLISDTSVLALQVTLNNRRETLFDTRLALVEAEQELARVVGFESLEGVELDDSLDGVFDLNLAGAGVEDSYDVAVSRLAVEQAEVAGRLNNLEDRPSLAMSLRATPNYPDQRGDPSDFASSISDYFEEGAGLSATVALDLSIPLLTRRERAARERIDLLTRERAAIGLETTEQAVSNSLRRLELNRGFLRERIELLELDVRYERERVANERRLLSAGVSTALRVDEVAVDLASRENELWQARAELLLNSFELASTLGQDIADGLR